MNLKLEPMNLNPQQIEFLQMAIDLATQNVETGQGGPFGAIIVKDGKVIATGANSVTQLNDPTAHAEVTAIRNACKILETYQLTDCEIYSSCEPCPMCLGAIYWARPKALFFAADKKEAADAGFDDDFIYLEIPKSLENRNLPTQRYLHPQRLKPFEKWNFSDLKLLY